jgi:hypothetical protein
MPWAARVVVPKLLQHVNQRGNHRADVFFDNEDRRFFLEQLVHYTRHARVFGISAQHGEPVESYFDYEGGLL